MITLSPSSLSDFQKSPLMFWLKKNMQIEVPRGAFPSLPGGIDRVLKAHYDLCRLNGDMPPELKGSKIPEQVELFKDQVKLKRWRFWKTGLQVQVTPEITVSGALDDLLYDPFTKLYNVLDYKTRGAAPKDGATEQYYGTQADTYDLMLRANGMNTTGVGYFAYYWPLMTCQAPPATHIGFGFAVEVVSIKTDSQRAAELAVKAAACLEGPMPDVDPNNEVEAFLVEAFKALGKRIPVPA